MLFNQDEDAVIVYSPDGRVDLTDQQIYSLYRRFLDHRSKICTMGVKSIEVMRYRDGQSQEQEQEDSDVLTDCQSMIDHIQYLADEVHLPLPDDVLQAMTSCQQMQHDYGSYDQAYQEQLMAYRQQLESCNAALEVVANDQRQVAQAQNRYSIFVVGCRY
jgi:hypothetical protein